MELAAHSLRSAGTRRTSSTSTTLPVLQRPGRSRSTPDAPRKKERRPQPWFPDLYSSLKVRSRSSLPTRCLDRKRAPLTTDLATLGCPGRQVSLDAGPNAPRGEPTLLLDARTGRTAAPSTTRRCTFHPAVFCERGFAGERIIHGRGRGAGASALAFTSWLTSQASAYRIRLGPRAQLAAYYHHRHRAKPPPAAGGAPL